MSLLSVLLLTSSLVLAAVDKRSLRQAYFGARSANVHTMGETLTGDDNLILLSGNVVSCPESVDITEMGDSLARSYWAGKLLDQPQVNVAPDLPSASLLLFNFGVDAENFQSFPNKQTLLEGTQATRLDVPFYPADEVAIVTSALTSRYPRTHGVVARTWNNKRGKPVEAFESNSEFASVLGVVDLMHQQHSVDVSVASLDPILARSLSQGHEALLPAEPCTWEELQEVMKTSEFWQSVQENVVNLGPEHQQFLLEMEMLNRVAQSFEKADEGKLQMYNLATTSLGDLQTLNEDVLTIFSSAVENVLVTFKSTFSTPAAQVAFIHPPTVVPDEELNAKLADMGHTPGQARLRGKEFAIACDSSDTSTACFLHKGQDGQTMTTYAIAFWLMFILSWMIVLFSCTFCSMGYADNEANLWSKWQRQS